MDTIGLDRSGPPLNTVVGYPYEGVTLTLRPGSTLLVYTDGVTDFENEKKEYYGVERLQDFILKHHTLDAEKFNKKLMEEVKAFKGVGGIFLDDITLLTCRFF